MKKAEYKHKKIILPVVYHLEVEYETKNDCKHNTGNQILELNLKITQKMLCLVWGLSN